MHGGNLTSAPQEEIEVLEVISGRSRFNIGNSSIARSAPSSDRSCIEVAYAIVGAVEYKVLNPAPWSSVRSEWKLSLSLVCRHTCI